MISLNGAKISGLICGIELIDQGFNVEIFEKRQEIGNPINGPGIINELSKDEKRICTARETKIGWALRREWFEKNLAKKFLNKGGVIHLKSKPPPNSHNTNNIHKKTWYGGVTIEENKPNNFIIDSINGNNLCFKRGDGLIECWSDIELPNMKNGWLEKIQGKHPEDINKLTINREIDEGQSIAQKIIRLIGGEIKHDSR